MSGSYAVGGAQPRVSELGQPKPDRLICSLELKSVQVAGLVNRNRLTLAVRSYQPDGVSAPAFPAAIPEMVDLQPSGSAQKVQDIVL
jgi:hypothetical protein